MNSDGFFTQTDLLERVGSVLNKSRYSKKNRNVAARQDGQYLIPASSIKISFEKVLRGNWCVAVPSCSTVIRYQ